MNEIGDFPIERGWVCPKCGRVMAPSQSYCLFCPLTTTTTTDLNVTLKSNWYYDRDDLEWWKKRLNKELGEVLSSWKTDT